MKDVLVYDPFYNGDEFCKDCGYETPHLAAFVHYNAKKHLVSFMFYCSYCEPDEKNSVPALLVTVTVDDWIAIVQSRDDSN